MESSESGVGGVTVGLHEIPNWLAMGGGGLLGLLAYRYFWPAMRDSFKGQSAQWRSENKYLTQLEAAREQSDARHRACEEKYDALFIKHTILEADMRILKAQFDEWRRKHEGDGHA